MKPWLAAHAFKPGQVANPGGKPRNRVKQMLEEIGKDPIKEIVKFLEDPEIKKEKKLDVWLELLSYLQGKPKEVEPSFTTEELAEMLEARLPPKEKAG